MQSELLRVKSREQVAAGVFRLAAETGGQAETPKPGQFYMLRRTDSATLLPRAISLCDAGNGELVFLIQQVGDGTRGLCELRPGDGLLVTGPLGNGFPVDFPGKIALVGGGIGAAPFLWTAKDLASRENNADCFFGFRDEPYLLDEIRPFAETLMHATESGSSGQKGFVTSLFNPADYAAVFACGPTPMLRAVVAACEKTDTPVYISLENKMACGVGACLVCTCADKQGKNRRVCKDGPVFNGREVDFDA